MSPLELLRQLNELDEHAHIEAKTASELSKPILETVCAFANEPGLGGGWMLLGAGLDEAAPLPRYVAAGLSDPDKISRDLATQCGQIFNRQIRVQIEPGLVEGARMLAVYVPEAAFTEKPIYFRNRALPAGAFRRIGSSNVHCTEDDLQIFYDGRRSESYDSTVLRDADLSALDPVAIQEYRRLRAEVDSAAVELQWSDEELLRALRCVCRDPVDGVVRPTVAGVLLFGASLALRRWFPLMRVDYIRVPGRNWMENPELRFEATELRLPLFLTINRACAAILDDLPKAFFLPDGELYRQDIPRIPYRVIREAVVNAVMHRSYRVQGAAQIIRYANRIEIRNPGHSLVTEDRLGEPGSETRNPIIASVLHDTKVAENRGSGIRVMRELMAEANLTPPAFESDREGNRFIATFLFHHFLTPEDWQWLGHFQDVGLTDEDARALVFVREAGAINNAAYRNLNRVDVLNASQRLRRLRDRGLLLQKGKGSDTYYVPGDRLSAPLGAQPDADSVNRANNAGTSASNAGTSPSSPGDLASIREAFPGLPLDLQNILADLKGKVPQPEMEQLVWRLCAWQALTVEELAQLLRRSRSHVQERLANPMLRAGRLEMVIPGQPNHPQQAYRAVVATTA